MHANMLDNNMKALARLNNFEGYCKTTRGALLFLLKVNRRCTNISLYELSIKGLLYILSLYRTLIFIRESQRDQSTNL